MVGHPKPASGTIDAPLAREDNASGAKSRVVEGAERSEDAARAALTRFQTLKKIGPYSLLQVVIETGRLHQIRAHLAHVGHPVVGDTRYDRPVEARQHLRDLGLKRMFLHAEEVSWEENGETRVFRAPLPFELQRIVEE